MTSAIPATRLLDPAVVEDPNDFYRQLRSEAPVWEIPGTGLFTVSTFELLSEASARVEDFSSRISFLLYRGNAGLPQRWSYGDIGSQALAAADPPEHTLHRKTVFPELVAKRMSGLEPDITDLATSLIGAAIARGGADFMTSVADIVPITIISRLIGFAGSDLGQLRAAAFDSTAMLGATLSLDELMTCVGRTAEIQEWIAAQLAEAVTHPEETLLGTVARAVTNGTLNDFQAIIILHNLLSAGGETTTSLLGNAVRILAEEPALQQHLRDQPAAIPSFVEEALRLESPFRFQMRSVPRDTTLGGVEIPAGSTLLLLYGAANRDDAEFDRADEIDLARPQPRLHLSFGRGIHHCVGAHLARVEARAVLTVLLNTTSNFTLDPNSPPQRVNSLMVRRHGHLPLRLTPA